MCCSRCRRCCRNVFRVNPPLRSLPTVAPSCYDVSGHPLHRIDTPGRLAVGDGDDSDADRTSKCHPPNENGYWDSSQERVADQISAEEPYLLNPAAGDARPWHQEHLPRLSCGGHCSATAHGGAAISIRPAIDLMGSGQTQSTYKLRTVLHGWWNPPYVRNSYGPPKLLGLAAGLGAYHMTRFCRAFPQRFPSSKTALPRVLLSSGEP